MHENAISNSCHCHTILSARREVIFTLYVLWVEEANVLFLLILQFLSILPILVLRLMRGVWKKSTHNIAVTLHIAHHQVIPFHEVLRDFVDFYIVYHSLPSDPSQNPPYGPL